MMCCRGEPDLRDVLDDPMVRAVMKADRVNPRELEAKLAALGETLRRRAAK